MRLHSSVFLSAPAALQQTFDDFPWHFVLFVLRDELQLAISVEWGSGWHKLVLFTVMAEYSEPVKVRGQDFFFFSPLPSTPSQTLRKMANPTSTEEVTDSFRHDKPLWKSLASVDKVCVMFGEALFMQSEQTSFLISRV